MQARSGEEGAAAVMQLGQIAVRIASAQRLSDVLQAAVRSARQLVDARFAVIHFVDRVVGAIDATVHDGYPVERIPEGVVPRGIGVLGRIMRGGTVYTEDVTAEPDFAGFPEWHPGIGSMIGVPVRHGQDVHAILILARGPGEPPFADEDLFYVDAVAGLTAVAIHVALQKDELEQARREAEAVGEARSELLITLATDMKDHVNTIMGMAEVLMGSPLTPDQRTWVGSVSGNAEAILSHLEETLERQKVFASTTLAETMEFDPAGMVRHVADVLSRRRGPGGVPVRLELEPGIPRRLQGDPGRLRHVLSILLDNALRYTQVVVEELTDGLDTYRIRAKAMGNPRLTR